MALTLIGGVGAIYGAKVLTDHYPVIVINEACSSNIKCCEDAEGNFPDWVELYNRSEDSVDISGYRLTGISVDQKVFYTVPEGTVMDPGTFYLFDPGFVMPSEGCSLYLYDNNNIHQDHVKIPKMFYDTTFARSADGENDWSVRYPTPGYENAEGEVAPTRTDGKVTASVAPGFYPEGFDLTLDSNGWGNNIYYTLDGTDPKKGGIEYVGPVRIDDRSSEPNEYSMIDAVSLRYKEGDTPLPEHNLDKCTTVRAVSKDRFGRFTDTYTFSYFVGFEGKKGYDDMTVISAVADPDDLFGYDDGIMVLGLRYDEYVAAGEPEEYEGNAANFTRRGRTSERDASVEIFDTTRDLVLSTPAGLRVKGLSSRWDEQKSFSIFFRKGYGGRSFERFSTGDTAFDVHSIALEKCGQDEETKMVDVIMNNCLKDTGCAVRDEVPAALFLNGEYWGFYWLTQRFDSYYLSDMYGINKDNVEFMDMENFEGDSAWNEDNFDRDLLIKYYASNIITAHTGDWPMFNFRFWRTREAEEDSVYGDTKLRPVIFDMNSRSMDDPSDDTYGMLSEFYPFKKLGDEDENFTKDLFAEIERMRSDEFETSRVLDMIEDIRSQIQDQMILDKMRYYGMSEEEAAAAFDEGVSALEDFFKNRGAYLDGIR